ncbi:hypothetical protein KQH31_30840, partial [Streptomyces sp. CHA15]|nr:hypothetical protein [Streptomyces sp. CHA15]
MYDVVLFEYDTFFVLRVCLAIKKPFSSFICRGERFILVYDVFFSKKAGSPFLLIVYGTENAGTNG